MQGLVIQLEELIKMGTTIDNNFLLAHHFCLFELHFSVENILDSSFIHRQGQCHGHSSGICLF